MTVLKPGTVVDQEAAWCQAVCTTDLLVGPLATLMEQISDCFDRNYAFAVFCFACFFVRFAKHEHFIMFSILCRQVDPDVFAALPKELQEELRFAYNRGSNAQPPAKICKSSGELDDKAAVDSF